jgi:hypothetical protein
MRQALVTRQDGALEEMRSREGVGVVSDPPLPVRENRVTVGQDRASVQSTFLSGGQSIALSPDPPIGVAGSHEAGPAGVDSWAPVGLGPDPRGRAV